MRVGSPVQCRVVQQDGNAVGGGAEIEFDNIPALIASRIAVSVFSGYRPEKPRCAVTIVRSVFR